MTRTMRHAAVREQRHPQQESTTAAFVHSDRDLKKLAHLRPSMRLGPQAIPAGLRSHLVMV
jgi:hypothetical protein